MGLSDTHIGTPARRDRLLLLRAAMAHPLLTLPGAASEASGLERGLELNTVKLRTRSPHRRGLRWCPSLPELRDRWLDLLMTHFDRIVRADARLSGFFGVNRGDARDRRPAPRGCAHGSIRGARLAGDEHVDAAAKLKLHRMEDGRASLQPAEQRGELLVDAALPKKTPNPGRPATDETVLSVERRGPRGGRARRTAAGRRRRPWRRDARCPPLTVKWRALPRGRRTPRRARRRPARRRARRARRGSDPARAPRDAGRGARGRRADPAGGRRGAW